MTPLTFVVFFPEIPSGENDSFQGLHGRSFAQREQHRIVELRGAAGRVWRLLHEVKHTLLTFRADVHLLHWVFLTLFSPPSHQCARRGHLVPLRRQRVLCGREVSALHVHQRHHVLQNSVSERPAALSGLQRHGTFPPALAILTDPCAQIPHAPLLCLQRDFLSIELVEGKVHLTFELGSGALTLTSSRTYNTGAWYRIALQRNKRKGAFLLSILIGQLLEGLFDMCSVRRPFIRDGR